LSWYLSKLRQLRRDLWLVGAAIGLMMWMWMSAIIVLYGAELTRKSNARPAPARPLAPPRTAPRPWRADGQDGAGGFRITKENLPKKHWTAKST